MHTFTRAALLAALIGIAMPGLALAHQGLIHTGCDPTATFTAGPIAVSAAFTRAMLPNAPTAGGYFTVSNSGPDDDRLLGAKSEAAAVIQLHQMSMEGNMMVMGEVADGLAIPAGGSVTLQPENGFHLMFMNIRTPFKEGECVQVTLTFAKAGDVPVVLSIASVAAKGPPDAQMKMDPGMKMDGMDMGGAAPK